MAKKFDIVITIIFVILNTLLMLYNKSISHPYYLGYLIVLIYVGFAYFSAVRKNTKLLVIAMILSFIMAILSDYLRL